MKPDRYPLQRDRRNIGKVVSPIEKMMAAREQSSCCVGVEALLEADAGVAGVKLPKTPGSPARKR